MGQYYHPVINYYGDVLYSNRKVKGGDYEMAKLIEHSYFGNTLMDAVASILHNYETKLAWVGDYAEGGEVEKITNGEASYTECWGGTDENGDEIEDKAQTIFDKVKFDYSHKYLINLTKKEYISFDDYMAKATNEWQYNPISILTAIGNGHGGGDYHSKSKKNMALVGTWAWDKITIDDDKPKKGFKKLNVDFGSDVY